MASIAAHADGREKSVALLPKYQQECSSCHVAYPPDMLPAASWQRLMNGLPQHFGADASLDPETVKQVLTWLTQHAGTGRDIGKRPPEDRITRSSWFVKEHHEVSAATWKLPAVKSASNCAACHTRAEQGDFSERFVRIPR
nr:diheme cytochrome c [Noviherbaspirillum pedocola]